MLQNNKQNEHSTTFIVAPITSKKKKSLPTHFLLKNTTYPFLRYGNNIIILEQLKTVSISRLGSFLGSVTDNDLSLIIERITNNFVEINKR